MKKRLSYSLLLICLSSMSIMIAQANSLEIDNLDNAPHPAYEDFFDYQVDVFGVMIYVSDDFDDDEILHVAGVMAQYLDNDEDGKVDNPLVVDAMIDNGANIFMLDDEEDLDEFDEALFEDEDNEPDFLAQVILSYDVVVGSSREDEFDATIEEVWHLISFSGYAYAYPDVFGEEVGTVIADLMDEARGGQFFEVPRHYPDDAWFTYDDDTCEYDCMISEYFYWALTSLLGGQDFAGRAEEIDWEWRLYTPELMREGDPDMVELLEDPEYALPSVLPDGNYQGQNNGS